MRIGMSVTRSGTAGPRLASVNRSIGQRVERGLMAVAHALLRLSLPLVPIDTLTLADSGRVSKIGSGLRTTAVVGYGGTDLPSRHEYSVKEGRWVDRKPSDYAVTVHENLNVAHNPGQAEFLKDPLLNKQDDLRLELRLALK